jgi:hypothetical protein
VDVGKVKTFLTSTLGVSGAALVVAVAVVARKHFVTALRNYSRDDPGEPGREGS